MKHKLEVKRIEAGHYEVAYLDSLRTVYVRHYGAIWEVKASWASITSVQGSFHKAKRRAVRMLDNAVARGDKRQDGEDGGWP
jgi:hypothetical protein